MANAIDVMNSLLPPANEVWGKVICLQLCVCPQGGVPALGGVCSRGSGPGGTWWRTPTPTATAAGGTHPTGMHSYIYFYEGIYVVYRRLSV